MTTLKEMQLAAQASKRWHRFGSVTPVANGVLKWGGWEIEHGDDGIHVDRDYYPRSRPVTFSASITCAINEGELTNFDSMERRQLTQAQINQLAYVECIYADAGLENSLIENRK